MMACAVAYAELLRSRGLWAVSAYHFTGTYALYFIIAWLPLYLVKVRGYDITDMALLTSLFYLGQTLGAAGSAALGDRLIAGGRAASAVRRTIGVTGSVCRYARRARHRLDRNDQCADGRGWC